MGEGLHMSAREHRGQKSAGPLDLELQAAVTPPVVGTGNQTPVIYKASMSSYC